MCKLNLECYVIHFVVTSVYLAEQIFFEIEIWYFVLQKIKLNILKILGEFFAEFIEN